MCDEPAAQEHRLFLRLSCIAVLISILASSACSQEPPVPAREAPPNFIILIGDDMAVETLDCYGVGQATAVTPNLDSLCAAGMRFDNFWAQPVCSPTRATILSGRYGFRTGVGAPATSGIPAQPVPELSDDAHKELGGGGPPRREAGENVPAPGLRADEFTLPMALKADASTWLRNGGHR